MDPQKLSQLDPKLRDAYQRIMGTPLPEPQAAPASTRGEPVKPQTPAPPAYIPNPISAPQPQPEPTPPFSIPQQKTVITPEQQSGSNIVNSAIEDVPIYGAASSTTPVQTQPTALKPKNSMLMTVMIGVAIVVFFLVYTLFWTKIFNLKLPFLP